MKDPFEEFVHEQLCVAIGIPLCANGHVFESDILQCDACGAHEHTCPQCGEQWSHRRIELTTEEEQVTAHTCRLCGAESWNKTWHKVQK